MKPIRMIPLLACCLCASTASAQATAPVHVQVQRQPMLAQARGQAWFVYELHVSNLYDRPLSLDSVLVLAGEESGAPVRTYAGAALEKNLHRIGAAPDSAAANVLGAGQTALVFVWAPAAGAGLLAHRLVLSTERGTRIAFATPPVAVNPWPPLILGAPLRGDGWIAGNAPDPDSTPGHNRMLVGVGGRVVLPQRFAIDWTRLGADGRLWHTDPARNENWAAWDAEVLAVSAGTVIEAVDTLPDQTPPEFQPGAANRLVLDVGGGFYAVYAHLRQGSLRVRAGDRVRIGQVVATVGNSGNSTGAHLHFQVLNAPSYIAGESVPYAFDAYEVQGVLDRPLDDFDAGASWRPEGRAGVEHRGDLPVGGEVIRFP
ncbi:MAG TPA: M23 family metallopeptidase [Longimicrobium sp.]|nr:M23 family metallopeptidase [Longimicrobium sp.]